MIKNKLNDIIMLLIIIAFSLTFLIGIELTEMILKIK